MRILFVEDDRGLRVAIARQLTRHGFNIEQAGTAAAAKRFLAQGGFDGVLADICLDPKLRDRAGIDLIAAASARGIRAIAFSAMLDAVTVRDAFRAGALDFVVKNDDGCLERIIETFKKPLALRTGPSARAMEPAPGDPLSNLAGRAPSMCELRERILRLAKRDDHVLIEGETGTGKDVVAQTIHALSERPGDLVVLNVGAANANLFDAALFGHERGAFTGATLDRKGIFEEAGRGTVLLDEIGDLPLPQQVHLLRVLQERRVRRVGAASEVAVHARILCATHVDLAERVQQGRFREDLYYRLMVLRLEVPPLRSRRDDIPLLAAQFALENNIALKPEAVRWLAMQPFPGNVRQLQNILRAAAAFGADGGLHEVADAYASQVCDRVVPRESAPVAGGRGARTPRPATVRAAIQEDLAESALDRSSGNVSAAARALGVSRHALSKRADRATN